MCDGTRVVDGRSVKDLHWRSRQDVIGGEKTVRVLGCRGLAYMDLEVQISCRLTKKLIWLDCKLTGQAALTLETLDADTRNDFEASMAGPDTPLRARGEEVGVSGEVMGLPEEERRRLGHRGREHKRARNSGSPPIRSGFAMSQFLALYEEDSDLTIGVCRCGPKTPNDAVQEIIRLEYINDAPQEKCRLSPRVADLAKSIQGIAGLKTSQEQNFVTMNSSLNEHENRLRQLESANNGRAPRKQGCFKCRRYAEVAKPLHELSRKGNEFKWTADCEVVVFTNKIRPYLLGRPFCLVRWSDKLQEFNYEMVHREVGIAVKPVVLPEAASDKNISSLQLLDHDIGPILRRYKMVAMDFLGPFVESEEGNRYILVLGDHFTKYMSTYASPNQEAKTVARILVEKYFCRMDSQSNSIQIRDYNLNQT
eukprot:Em0001g2072a